MHQIPKDRPGIAEIVRCDVSANGVLIGNRSTQVDIQPWLVSTPVLLLWSGDIDLGPVPPGAVAVLEISLSQDTRVLKTETHRIVFNEVTGGHA